VVALPEKDSLQAPSRIPENTCEGDECLAGLELSLLQTSLAVSAGIDLARDAGRAELKERTSSISQATLEAQVLQRQALIESEGAVELLEAAGLIHEAVSSKVSMVIQYFAHQGVAAGIGIGITAGVVVAALAFVLMMRSATPASDSKATSLKEQTSSNGSIDSTGAPAADSVPMRTVLFYVIGHSISASTLTVVNKWAMNSFHPPAAFGVPSDHHGYVWTLSFLQFICAALVAKLVGISGLDRVDALEWKRAVAYFPAAGMFMITIVAGNAVMNYANVSTFLVLRSTVPIPCFLLELYIYKDDLPPMLSWACLLVVIGGAGVYGASTGGFELTVIAWSIVFLAIMPVDGLLIKHAISNSNLSSWGLVYYNNILAAMPLLFYIIFFEVPTSGALNDMVSALFSAEARVAVAASMVVGISISYFQMTARYYISATAFMVLGVVNKFLTVFWNEVFISRESTAALSGVLLALAGAVAWQVQMGMGSVKVRPKVEASSRNTMIAFGAAILGLAAAAFVQHMTMAQAKAKGA
jgi:hypothetical protein